MLNQEKVFEELVKHGVTFFTGVPDSYLNGFCNYALDNCGNRNIITANEGNPIAIASGHYFASKEISLVYMQNSVCCSHAFTRWLARARKHRAKSSTT